MSEDITRLHRRVAELVEDRDANHRLYHQTWQVLQATLAERDEARRERDLAVAHDQQPYPTADAYERACAALHQHRAAEERYRLAWQSARRRSHHGLVVQQRDDARAALERVATERDEALAAVQRTATLAAQRGTALVEMQRERDEARAEVRQWQDTYGESALRDAQRILVERDEARAEVVRLGKELEAWTNCFGEDEFRARGDRLIDAVSRSTRPWTDDERGVDADGRAYTRITVKRCCNGCGDQLGDVTEEEIEAGANGRPLPDVRGECLTCTPPPSALTDEQVEERIERIKRTAVDRLRAALDEERIEPEHTPECDTEEWHPRCAAVGPTGARCGLLRGSHPTHESSNGSGGSVSWPAGRTEGEAG